MKKLLMISAAIAMSAGAILNVQAGPSEDRAAFTKFYAERFPNVDIKEYADGVYAFDKIARANWEAIEEFPPYEPFIEDGQEMWEKPFANGKGYKDCFSDGPGVAHKYPSWDKEKGMVMTMALAVNNCRVANGEKPMKYKKGPINLVLAYMANESRGKMTNVVVPKDDPRAMDAYNKGKKFFFARRGQLNFSCASCHIQNAGNSVRTEFMSPSIGHTTHWPSYRSKWGTVGTLHRRFTGCNKNIRAKPMKAQGEEYRNLEYFLTSLSNGIELNAPGTRK
ncbi:MAG: sulfur oxidation c-type cytochrome SoxA [Sedimenticola sp.]